MAFQIFDDVAFYFASVCLLAVILIPYSIYLAIHTAVTKVKPPVDPHSQSSAVCGCPDCVSKTEFLRLHGDKGAKKRKWGVKHVLFVLGWLLFAYLIFQLPSMQTQNMATFNPYDIIGVATDASDAEIKRAYRKKALELHPDVVAPDQRDAAAGKFQLLAKAMELLSDTDQRRKWDEGGETGTYTRPTGSIGLPSWLTEKKNEVPVLLLYFMLMILLPPICVYLWWRDARNYHDTGVLNQTVGHFFNFLKEDHSVKFLIETLATAWEYRVLEDRQPVGPDVDKLLKTLKEAKAAGSGQVKAKYNRPYIVKANALLHAYLLRLPIPDSLLPDLHVVLKDAHRLLNVMLDISLSRLFLRPSLAILDLQQMITQALWVHKSPLLQLPSFDEQDLRAGQRKGLNTIVAFKKADDEKKKAVFGHSDGEWKSINAVAALLPAISVDCSYEVADEKGLYEGDIVTLNVKITRLRDLNQLTESETSSVSMEGGEEEDGDEDDAGAAKAAKRDRKDKRKAAAADEAKSSTNGDSGKHESALGDAAASSTTTPSGGDSKEAAERKARGEASRAEFEKKEKSNAHLSEEERIQQLQLSAPREKDIDPENAPFVHCPRFPFAKRERWVLLLVERGVKTRIIAKTKSAAFDEKFEFPVTFRAPRAGTIVYEVHAKCDSYIGVDQIKTVPLKIESRPSKPIKLRELESESDEEDEENEGDEKEAEEEPVVPGKWYYLGASTMWELLLNVLVLGVLFFFAKEFLQSRGYWQRYVTPVIDVVTHIAGPPAKTVYGVIAPVADPVVGVITAAAAWLGQKLYSPVDPAELKAKRKKYHDDY